MRFRPDTAVFRRQLLEFAPFSQASHSRYTEIYTDSQRFREGLPRFHNKLLEFPEDILNTSRLFICLRPDSMKIADDFTKFHSDFNGFSQDFLKISQYFLKVC